MMKKTYTYTISKEYSPEEFWRVVKLLDAALPSDMPRKFTEDPLGEFLLMCYGEGDQMVRCECDWEIGAVFVDSTINRDRILRKNIIEGR